MKAHIILALASTLLLPALAPAQDSASPAAPTTVEAQLSLATPSEKQLRFADWEVGAFIHYGLNPYTGQEHGDGQEPASKFNPTELDTEQWVITAKKMGAKYACLTARHEGGFCLWPTKTTEYSIKNSPYKDGKGDIVREFVDACRKHGIQPALYHSADFDANAVLGSEYAKWGTQKLPLQWNSKERGIAFREARDREPNMQERLVNMQREQLRELLTNYGPIAFVWSDHWNAADPKGIWRTNTDLAAELQPNLVFMGPDTWVPGNETGHVVYPMWNGVHTVDGTKYTRPQETEKGEKTQNDYGLLETQALTGHPFGEFWRVRECTTNSGFAQGGWFWHPGRTKPHSLAYHIDLYYRTVGLGANTIINLPPDTRGLIPDNMVAAAEAFGKAIKERFSHPIAELDKVVVGETVELAWERPQEINTIVTMENIANGQRIAAYDLQAMVDGEWVSLTPANTFLRSWKPYNPSPGFQTIGHKKIDRVEPVVTNKIRFVCKQSVLGTPEIRKISVYKCEPYAPESTK